MRDEEENELEMSLFLGLIIDAFGDLREQLDSVKETLEVRRRGYQLD